MTTSANNPFVLPGFGQSGDVGQNPLLASMEMMRQAWQGLSGAGALSQPSIANPMTVEELDRRIADLRAVENWLHMNTSMLSSSIQALEVQRATIATIKSFMPVQGMGGDADNPSPLEVALGIKPAGQAKIKKASRGADGVEQPASPAAAGESAAASAMAGAEAAQGWWNMLQEQFNTLAAATATNMQQAATPPAGQKPVPTSRAAPAKKAATKRAAVKRASKTSASQSKGGA